MTEKEIKKKLEEDLENAKALQAKCAPFTKIAQHLQPVHDIVTGYITATGTIEAITHILALFDEQKDEVISE